MTSCLLIISNFEEPGLDGSFSFTPSPDFLHLLPWAVRLITKVDLPKQAGLASQPPPPSGLPSKEKLVLPSPKWRMESAGNCAPERADVPWDNDAGRVTGFWGSHSKCRQVLINIWANLTLAQSRGRKPLISEAESVRIC